MKGSEADQMARKITTQAKTIRLLREQLRAAEDGVRQISATVDAVLAQIALTCGTRTKDGWTLTVPAVDVAANNERYAVTAGAADGRYVLRVTQRQKAE